MKCFKISLVTKLFACTIIPIFMIDMYVVDGINVYMNENIFATSGDGGMEMKCAYSKEKVKIIFTVAISILNKTANGDFVSIVTFLPDQATVINHAGENLRDRIAMTNITQESTEATFTFNEIKCTDQNQYRCTVFYLNTNNDADSDMSLPTTINVTVKPQKPHISSDTHQQNQNIGKRSILQREVIHHTSLYHTTTATDPDISSLLPDTTISIKKLLHQEGDNLTFVCNGNVGRPPGNMLWQTIYTKENTSFSYANGTMETEPIYGKCSLNITSYFIIQLSAKYFNARIRCFVISQDGNIIAYDEIEPLNFNFGVRNVSINKLPDKEIYDTNIGSITLTCNGDGNPKPAYAWYRKKNNNIILSTSNKYVITNVIQNNSGTYICEVSNTISGDIHNDSISVEIIIEYINDSSEDKNSNSERDNSLWIGMVIGGIAIITVVCAFVIYKCHAQLKRLQEDITKNTSSPLMEHCATNPGYTSNQETYIDCNIMDNTNCILEDEKECKLKQEKDENEMCNTADQTNNEAVSYAYVMVSPDYQTEKDTNMESQDMLKPSTVDEKNKLSTTENPCDDSTDHYASSVLGIYDELHDNRHKTDNDEKFDRMFELQRRHEEINKFIEKNTSTEHRDSIMLNCHALPQSKSKHGGYESVVIEEDLPVLSLEGSKSVHGDIEIVRLHKKEYWQHQKEEEKKLNESPISTQPVEYAQVNETTKLQNKKRQNDTDQETVDTSSEIHERIQVVSEERHAKSDEDDDQLDNKKIISKENSDVETKSIVKDNHTICNINSTFENDSVSIKVDTIKMAMVSPTIRSLGSSEKLQQNGTTKVETKDWMNFSQKVDDDDESYNTTKSTASSEDDKQKENINVEIKQGTNVISGRTVDNASYFDTTIYLNKPQTNGDPESSITNIQNGSCTNQAFEIEDIQNKDAISSTFRSTDGLQNDGGINQNNDTKPKNEYENVGSTDHPDTSNGDTTH